MAKMRWINHASYLINHKNIILVCDPWLQGSAFNNGWDLISSTKFKAEDFRDVTHIWFSHEHPDHFVPSTLKMIPSDIRKKICVLFQKTKDKKVIKYCQNLG